ncbi:TrkH family potassium uptake protein [Carnobacterium maltaromaticum]|uniref:TrkH family potassium uptake protein n=1 Tax=Carnobacterium maltaromaticum TaxID=2751 RepID=UPI00165BBC20|nr:Trk family potassium uptake protein [Carnobacterium maltaromaticum]
MHKKRRLKRPRWQLLPSQFLALGFLSTIFIGGILLSLPFASQANQATNLLDAFFTATSAVCVTGLTTLNTAVHWSLAGKLIIMLLIEIGGLGFMSFTIIILLASRKKINFRTRIIMKEALNTNQLSGGVNFIIYILKFSVGLQLLAACLLSIDFIPRYGLAKGAFFSLFHSVSAFCNAGFDLFGNSLESFQKNPLVLGVLSFLIIAGGLGFIVWRDLLTYRKNKRLSFHSKLTLRVTFILLIGGFLFFLLTEQNLSHLKDLTFGERLMNTFFLTVTPRTAGFNSVSFSGLSQASILLSCFLMYIGGSSGSTAGGIKTTTLGILVMHAYSVFKGEERTQFSGRSINPTLINRAFVLLFITMTVITMAIITLSITETIPPDFGIEYIVFEVFSAFGTVGVTLGLTPQLTAIGKIIIMALMFTGRIGMFTFLLSIIKRTNQANTKIKYPEENVIIG